MRKSLRMLILIIIMAVVVLPLSVALGDWDDWIGGAAGVCPHEASCTGVCRYCGEPYTEGYVWHGNMSWQGDDKNCWETCDDCGEIMHGPYHHSEDCGNPGFCFSCGMPYKGVYRTHYPNIIQYNAEKHWKVCPCGESSGSSYEHYTDEGDPEGICSECGYEYGSAVNPAPDSPASGSATLDNAYGKLAIIDANGNLVDYTGFEKFEGGSFYFEHGVIRDDMDGLTLIDGTWYNMTTGQVNTSEGFVFFEGGTFYVKNGTLDKTQDGLIQYDGEWFVFSNGQFQPQVYGAWPDHRSGKFVYIWAGQFYPITDLVSYDGEIFYFINGYLATDFVGTVYDFNGTPFNVVYGQVY